MIPNRPLSPEEPARAGLWPAKRTESKHPRRGMNQIFTAFRLGVGAANGRGCARHFLIALALVSAGGTSVSPRQSGQTPPFRTRVDAVTVDVNATDAQGRPVTISPLPTSRSKRTANFNRSTRFDDSRSMRLRLTPRPRRSLHWIRRSAKLRGRWRLIAVFLDDTTRASAIRWWCGNSWQIHHPTRSARHGRGHAPVDAFDAPHVLARS